MNRPAFLALLAIATGLAVFGLVGGEPTRESSGGTAQRPDRVGVVGLMVSGPAAGEEGLAFDASARTRLALELAWPEAGLIELRAADTVVLEFRDDRGTNLLTRGSHAGAVEPLARVSADGRGVVFVLRSDVQPDPRATRLVARGLAEITVGDDLIEHGSEPFDLVAGAIVRAGPFRLEVAEAGPLGTADGRRISFTSTTDLTPVVGFALLVDGERRIPLEPVSSASSGGVWRRTLTLPPDLARGRLVIEAWSQPRIEAVPFDVTAGLGLR